MRAALLILAFVLAPALRGQTTLFWMQVSPTTLTFSAPNPSSSPAPASATISWWSLGGSTSRSWTLRVQASPASVTNCPNVPVSAFSVSCASLGSSASGGTCTGTVPLSGAYQTIATGMQNSGIRTFSVTVNVRFTDSWRYPANTAGCSLDLKYTVEAP